MLAEGALCVILLLGVRTTHPLAKVEAFHLSCFIVGPIYGGNHESDAFDCNIIVPELFLINQSNTP